MFSKWKKGFITTLFALTTFSTVTSAEELPADQQKWQNWVREHAVKLQEPTASSNEDLSFLKQTLQGKRIVSLGESTHGSTEMNQSKVRIIKYLHEEMGYDVIAFESGFAEANAVYQNIDDLTAEQAMKKAILGVWHTEDVEELIQYIKEQKEKGTPLVLTGFDIQIPGDAATAIFAKSTNEWIEKLDPEIGKLLVEAEGEIPKYRSVSSYKEFQVMQASLLDKYEKIKEFIQHYKNELQQVAPKASYDVNLLEKSIQIRISALKTCIPNDVKERKNIPPEKYPDDFPFYNREQGMAQNLAWLSEMQFKNKKIIVWGHNYHIRKQNSKMVQTVLQFPNMMDMIPHYLKNQMYTVGLFAYSGSSLGMDNHKLVPVKETHQANSVEEILKVAQHPQVFVNLKGEENRPETSWMYRPIIGQYWGFIDEIMIPNQQYDGILWLEHISPSRIK
ncbi:MULTISPECIES: erythromycin esterase family protein [unclassified Bacillus (in: firmicutes)]|uniref:erythromycin esterase family protein n=1 Tax=unclassified Bacillus (in: firmicutes) TaxID=185979 RepID=UPI0008E434ED|nr:MULTISPECIES: erythromycin esterase family protein [unclassified Bacillus (in: firmicutes)]SFI05698.1 erythromycin esterase [Bacillus sp. 71mf]SFS79306.1 erythromycin esterase [Bacillus sp. 103mf]